MDAALVNNWEEMSGTHYNMQQDTNAFTSRLPMLLLSDAERQENVARPRERFLILLKSGGRVIDSSLTDSKKHS